MRYYRLRERPTLKDVYRELIGEIQGVRLLAEALPTDRFAQTDVVGGRVEVTIITMLAPKNYGTRAFGTSPVAVGAGGNWSGNLLQPDAVVVSWPAIVSSALPVSAASTTCTSSCRCMLPGDKPGAVSGVPFRMMIAF